MIAGQPVAGVPLEGRGVCARVALGGVLCRRGAAALRPRRPPARRGGGAGLLLPPHPGRARARRCGGRGGGGGRRRWRGRRRGGGTSRATRSCTRPLRGRLLPKEAQYRVHGLDASLSCRRVLCRAVPRRRRCGCSSSCWRRRCGRWRCRLAAGPWRWPQVGVTMRPPHAHAHARAHASVTHRVSTTLHVRASPRDQHTRL